jgi:hypothetical protein
LGLSPIAYQQHVLSIACGLLIQLGKYADPIGLGRYERYISYNITRTLANTLSKANQPDERGEAEIP